jgi:predicted metal-dependent phosphoesterase TrpH
MKIDFHVHTKYSIDSLIEPAQLMKKSKELGIVPAIADHSSIDAHSKMRELGARFIPGEEIFTDKGDLIGLYLNERIPKGTEFNEAVDLVHEQGGLAYLPHMYDYGRSKRHATDKDASRADIIEVFNARCLNQEFNRKAAVFAEKNKKLCAVGSDSHFLFEFGKTYVELPDFDLENPKALLKALASKKAKFATKSTPFFVRGTTSFIAIGRKFIRRLRF